MTVSAGKDKRLRRFWRDPRATIGTDVDAYLAGFFDGEGSVSVLQNNSGLWGYNVKITATNTNIEPLNLLLKVYGGRVSQKTHDGNPNHKLCYQWVASGKDAHWALSRMLPWLRVKLKKAMAALIVLDYTPHKGSHPSPSQKAAVTKSLKLFPNIIPINKEITCSAQSPVPEDMENPKAPEAVESYS